MTQPLRVAAFVQLGRTKNPTGVGKHINNMVAGLALTPGVRLEVAAARDELDAGGAIPPASALFGLTPRPLPWRRRTLERSWRLLNWPKIERWCGEVDWVYAPGESYVATRRARFAGTLHCLMWFERDKPWGQGRSAQRVRLMMRSILRPTFKHARVIIAVSQFLKSSAVRLFGVDPNRIEVVPNGVEPEFFAAGDQPPPTPGPRPYVVAVGGLTTMKGAPHLLGLARALQQIHCDVDILIAGHADSPYAQEAAALANVRHLGYVGKEALPMLVRGAAAMVFPSRYETFGIPILEAMAARTPVITARAAAMPEVAGEAALYLDEDRPDHTADLVRTLLNDAGAREQFAEAGRARAELFRWDRCVARLLSVLQARR